MKERKPSLVSPHPLVFLNSPPCQGFCIPLILSLQKDGPLEVLAFKGMGNHCQILQQKKKAKGKSRHYFNCSFLISALTAEPKALCCQLQPSTCLATYQFKVAVFFPKDFSHFYESASSFPSPPQFPSG